MQQDIYDHHHKSNGYTKKIVCIKNYFLCLVSTILLYVTKKMDNSNTNSPMVMADHRHDDDDEDVL